MFPVDPAEKRLKRYMLGINSHIQSSLEKKFLEEEEIWFADYLSASSAEDAKEDSAQVTVLLRIEQRTEALSQQHIASKLDDYRTLSYGQATHLVQKVTYGANVILWFNKKIDLNKETKESITSEISSVARNLVNEAIQLESDDQSKLDLPVDVSCSIFSTFPYVRGFMGDFTLPNCYRWLRHYIYADVQRQWQCIEITLRCISEQTEARVLAEDIEDARLESLIIDKRQDCAFSKALDKEIVIDAYTFHQQSDQKEPKKSEQRNGEETVNVATDDVESIIEIDLIEDIIEDEGTVIIAKSCQQNGSKVPEIGKQGTDGQKANEATIEVVCLSDTEESEEEIESNCSSPVNKERVSDSLACDIWENSNLIREGCPYVYLLNAIKCEIDADLKWFQFGQPEMDSSKLGSTAHKVIVLMGTVGCDKGTVIDGMINYILGVRWEDPFRSKITRDDDFNEEKQTCTVMAYTIYHESGMAIPYSITIIDIPCYGACGTIRDKEITQTIHRLLTKQAGDIEKIHAAYFVADSSNSKLTATQRYVIDSMSPACL